MCVFIDGGCGQSYDGDYDVNAKDAYKTMLTSIMMIIFVLID